MLSGLKILGIGLCASALYLASGCAPDLSTLDSLYDPNSAGAPGTAGMASTDGGRGNPDQNGGSGNDSSAGMATSTAGASTGPACSNSHRDANETDVDCGGTSTCHRCDDGLRCNASRDCSSGYCNTAKGLCAEPTCGDAVQNGDETAIDCGGGTCDGCDDEEACKVNADCASTFCKNEACANHCESGKKDGDETAIDCGGKDCDKCADKSACKAASDCTSGVCNNNVCQIPTCSDQVINQDESDQDCGGTVCAPCAVSATCKTAADCASYVCTNHKCVADINVLSDDIIDDFEDGDLSLPIPALGMTGTPPAGRVGTWYGFGDTGCPSPLRENVPMTRGKSKQVLHTTGSGCTDWGNGVGADIDNSGGSSATKKGYDATGTKGVTFWARAGKAVSVTVAIPNIDTDLNAVDHTCDTCDHHWFGTAQVTTEWQRFTILYAVLQLEGGDVWTKIPTPTAFAPKVVSVQFREAKLQDPTESYDLWIDDVAFVR